MTDLEANRRLIEKEKEEIASYKRELERLKNETASRQKKLDDQRDRIIREANEKAHAILLDAKETADETMKNFRKFGKENISAAEMEKERERLRKKLKSTSSKVTLETAKPRKKHKPSDFKLGESVRVLSMNLNGIITSLPDARGNLSCSDGYPKFAGTHVRSGDHRRDSLLTLPRVMQRTSKGKMKMSKSFSVSPEINLLRQDSG